jgi:curli biogenesis system outer membrane secretion channel CsgG
MIKKPVCCVWPVVMLSCLAGLASLQAQPEQPAGSKARLFVAEFRDKSAGGGLDALCLQQFNMSWRAVGEGMRDMMTTALFKTNRFQVVERDQLAEIVREQDLGASGRVQKGTEPGVGGIKGADLMVLASVTEFDSGEKAVKGTIHIAGVRVGGKAAKAHMAIDVRVIDVKTSQIVAATTIEGSGSLVGVQSPQDPWGALPPTLDAFSKTPLEKALRSCIQKSVQYISANTPAEYFRYK